MKKLLLAILLVLSFALPVMAQDVTETPDAPIVITDPIGDVTVVVEAPEAPVEPVAGLSPTEIILIAVLFIVVVGAGFAINALLKHNTQLAHDLRDALPEWAWDAIQEGTNRGFAELEDYVATTPNTLDDDLVRRFKELKEGFFGEMQKEIAQQVAKQLPPSKDGAASVDTRFRP